VKRKEKSRRENEEALEGPEKKKRYMITSPVNSKNFETFFDRSRKSIILRRELQISLFLFTSR
ncbi:17546_t:CDS:1, partial [Acaulospora colombiana]